jgi:hypothetical protein
VRSLSGGDDGLHGNQTIMEAAFESGDADWEITRYAGLGHGYTSPVSPDYSLTGDVRSWESMLSAFEDLMAMPLAPAPIMPPTESPVATPTTEPFPTIYGYKNPTMIDSGVSCIGIWKAVVVAVAAAALV